jgi:hypothetical protein
MVLVLLEMVSLVAEIVQLLLLIAPIPPDENDTGAAVNIVVLNDASSSCNQHHSCCRWCLFIPILFMATLATADACAGAAVNGDLFFCSYGTSSGFCKKYCAFCKWCSFLLLIMALALLLIVPLVAKNMQLLLLK